MEVPWIDDFTDPSVGLMKWHGSPLLTRCMCGGTPRSCVDMAFVHMQVEAETCRSRRQAGRPVPGRLAGRPGHLPYFAPFCLVLHDLYLHSNISTKLVEFVSSKA